MWRATSWAVCVGVRRTAEAAVERVLGDADQMRGHVVHVPPGARRDRRGPLPVLEALEQVHHAQATRTVEVTDLQTCCHQNDTCGGALDASGAS